MVKYVLDGEVFPQPIGPMHRRVDGYCERCGVVDFLWPVEGGADRCRGCWDIPYRTSSEAEPEDITALRLRVGKAQTALEDKADKTAAVRVSITPFGYSAMASYGDWYTPGKEHQRKVCTGETLAECMDGIEAWIESFSPSQHLEATIAAKEQELAALRAIAAKA